MARKNSKRPKRYPRVSKKQLQFLEYIVWRSKDANEFAKKCLIYLVRRSNGLTKKVRLVLDEVSATRLASGFHDMCSEGGTTHIDQLFHYAGSDMSVDYGNIGIMDYKHPHDHPKKFKPSTEEIWAIVAANPYA